MYVFLTAIMLAILTSLSGEAEASGGFNYDVAIIGAGTGGSAAAIQAARLGATVALIEESDVIGGQMAGAAVSTMDDVRRTRTGIYGEFLTRASQYYTERETPVNICYWGGDTFSFEPWVAQKTLIDMLKEAGKVDIYTQVKVLKVKKEKDRVSQVTIEYPGSKETLSAKVFIDATEAGDFIPLTGARYRAGSSLSPKINKTDVIQDITYCAVVRKYPDGVPEEYKLKNEPPNYQLYLPHFRKVIAISGDSWPGNYPYSPAVHNAYRALPDVANPNKKDISGSVPSSWPLISRTAINWANDYPGRAGGEAGMNVRFLEDKKFRRDAERKAMEKTLAFLYYMQHELNLSDWSVDDRQGYGKYFSNDWKNWRDMPEEFAPVLAQFPPFPYVRESRRIAGVQTMTVKDVARDHTLRRTLVMKPDSIALGEYPTDIHGLREPEHLDHDLGEKPEDIPAESDWKGGLFQIPMGVLIPEKINGLLAAEKNISVSRIVNGSTRLQPVTMLTGQAAGALAALAAKADKEPRDIPVKAVQSALLDAKDKLSFYNFDDVPSQSDWWKGVEFSVLYNYMDPNGETIFGVDDEMHWLEVKDAFRRAFGRDNMPHRDYTNIDVPITLDDFNHWLSEYLKGSGSKYSSVLAKYKGPEVMTKGQLAHAVADLMVLGR